MYPHHILSGPSFQYHERVLRKFAWALHEANPQGILLPAAQHHTSLGRSCLSEEPTGTYLVPDTSVGKVVINRLPLSQKTQWPPTSDTSTSNASPAAPPPSKSSPTREQGSMTVISLSASSHGSQPVVEQVMNIPRQPPLSSSVLKT